MMALQDFIQKHVEKVEPLETASQLSWWNLATTGDEKYAQEFQEKQIALRKIYSSPEEYRLLLSLQKVLDPLLSRQAELILNRYIENQIPPVLIETITKLETEIESIYTNFRASLDGRQISNNELKEILVESLDSTKRQKAWEASKVIGEQVEKKVLTLIDLRNRCAKEAGFDNFYSMRLKLQELDETRLFQLLDQLADVTNAHWKRYKTNLDEALGKRYGIAPTSLMPWHYHDPFFQEAPQQDLNFDAFYAGKDIVEISRNFFLSIGLPVDDILSKSDVFERDKKNQHAFCTCIDRKQDIRVLCNIRDNDYWMATQLHELGHAVYDKYIDQSLPYFLRTYAHTSTTEASAMLFGRLGGDSDFLHRYCGVDADAAHQAAEKGKKQTAADLLVFARWALVMIYFERAMYQQPQINLNQLWWDLVERFQGMKRAPSRNAPDWAAKLHLACAPVYYQNYVLGEMTASQLLHHIKAGSDKECIPMEGGEWLKTRLFKLGAKLPWEKALHYATGELLNPQYFDTDIASA